MNAIKSKSGDSIIIFNFIRIDFGLVSKSVCTG